MSPFAARCFATVLTTLQGSKPPVQSARRPPHLLLISNHAMLTRVCSCRLSTMINTSTALLLNTTKCTRPAAATAAFHTSRSPAAALGHLSISSSSVPSKLSYSSTSSSSTSIAAAAIHSSSHLGSNSVLLQSTAVLRVYHAGKYVAGRKSVRYYSSGSCMLTSL